MNTHTSEKFSLIKGLVGSQPDQATFVKTVVSLISEGNFSKADVISFIELTANRAHRFGYDSGYYEANEENARTCTSHEQAELDCEESWEDGYEQGRKDTEHSVRESGEYTRGFTAGFNLGFKEGILSGAKNFQNKS